MRVRIEMLILSTVGRKLSPFIPTKLAGSAKSTYILITVAGEETVAPWGVLTSEAFPASWPSFGLVQLYSYLLYSYL